jgi:catalase (peroxidase I)|tara:strand:+ start:396 stop:512 length:117 start_codon:yes stop_codon:yes gene_type:complete
MRHLQWRKFLTELDLAAFADFVSAWTKVMNLDRFDLKI